MKNLKTFEQFSSEMDAQQKIDEGLFTTDKYDILKEFANQNIRVIASKLGDKEFWLKEFYTILKNAGASDKDVKAFNSFIQKENRIKLVSLNEDAINKCIELIKTKGKEAKNEVNNTNLYKLNPKFSQVKAEGWKNASDKLYAWNNDPKIKNKIPLITGAENGQIVFGGGKVASEFAGGGTGSGSDASYTG